MQNNGISIRDVILNNSTVTFPTYIKTEMVRKTIHMGIAIVPMFVQYFGNIFTLALLATGTVFFAYAEYLRKNKQYVFFISSITVIAQRDRDKGHFTLGPLTLSIGTMMALFLYPNPVSFIAIYALAFGDGFSSLIGKIFGSIKIPGTGGKTIEGSLACFIAVFIAGYTVLGNFLHAAIIAAVSTLLEAFPTKDFDNILLPIGSGLVTSFLIL